MAITWHKAVLDEGGAIGDEIFSGEVGTLLPKVTLAQQSGGAIIYRKFYLANDDSVDQTVELDLTSISAFAAIVFKATDDAEVMGDLSGTETDETPLTDLVAQSGHSSYWIKITVAAGSTFTGNYNTVDMKLAH